MAAELSHDPCAHVPAATSCIVGSRFTDVRIPLVTGVWTQRPDVVVVVPTTHMSQPARAVKIRDSGAVCGCVGGGEAVRHACKSVEKRIPPVAPPITSPSFVRVEGLWVVGLRVPRLPRSRTR